MIDLEEQLSVVIQDEISSCSEEVIKNYLECPRISRVIFSTWNTPFPLAHPKLTVVYNEDPKNPGVGNRNRQIISSYFGLQIVKTKYAWKVRSDQIYPQEAINTYLDYFEEHFEPKSPKIFTPGLYSKEVFHIRDHQTLGSTKDVLDFWSCPLDDYEGPTDYNKCIRAEAYFVCHYLKHHSTAAGDAILNPDKYLYDNAPLRAKMLESSNKIMPKHFVPLPRVNFAWPKHGMSSYHYDVAQRLHGEYWDEDIK